MSALVLGASSPSATLVAVLIGSGVLVGLAGHLAGSRRTVVIGLAILFAATALMLVSGYAAFREDPRDERPCDYAPQAC